MGVRACIGSALCLLAMQQRGDMNRERKQVAVAFIIQFIAMLSLSASSML